LNVVEPSPAPYSVPISVNSAAYDDLDTAAPFAFRNPGCTVPPKNGTAAPTGTGIAHVPSARRDAPPRPAAACAAAPEAD